MGTAIKHSALARKCLINSLGDTLKSPSNVHSWNMVLTPTVAMVKSPTHLQLTTAPRDKPESVNHVHHDSVNGSCLSSLQNPVHKNVVRAVKKMRGESSRMCRD